MSSIEGAAPAAPSPEPQPLSDEIGDECASCGESEPVGECSKSKRACGHHCNHSWEQDVCCWCGKEFGEASPEPQAAAVPVPLDEGEKR